MNWFSPNQIARERGVGTHKVLGWIKAGALEAVNCAAKASGPPRWKISAKALEMFDATRSNRVIETVPRPRRTRRTREPEIIQFF